MVWRVVSSVLSVTRAAITRAVMSIITLAAVGGTILKPAAHAYFPCFKHRSIGIARAKFGIE